MTMKKYALPIISSIALATFIIYPAPVFAASQDECAIWLCAPGGFPSGCEAAKKAMKHRLRKGKSPLPAFSACAVKDKHTNPDDFTYTFKKVLKIEEHRVCEHYVEGKNKTSCAAYKTVPAHFRAGNSCYKGRKTKDNDPERIEGCSAVLFELKVFEKGQQFGEPFYFQ